MDATLMQPMTMEEVKRRVDAFAEQVKARLPAGASNLAWACAAAPSSLNTTTAPADLRFRNPVAMMHFYVGDQRFEIHADLLAGVDSVVQRIARHVADASRLKSLPDRTARFLELLTAASRETGIRIVADCNYNGSAWIELEDGFPPDGEYDADDGQLY